MVLLIFCKLKKKKKKDKNKQERHGDLLTILEKFGAGKAGARVVVLGGKEVGEGWEWQQERRGLELVE